MGLDNCLCKRFYSILSVWAANFRQGDVSKNTLNEFYDEKSLKISLTRNRKTFFTHLLIKKLLHRGTFDMLHVKM